MKRPFSFQNKLIRRYQIVILIMAVIAPPTIAQTADEVWNLSQRDFSVGARMTGMSTRGYAGYGDFSSLNSNPAGLGFINGTHLLVSLRRSTFDSSIDEILANGFRMERRLSSVDNSGLGNLTIVWDLPVEQGKLVAGLGIARVRDFSRRLDLTGENNQSTISTSFLPFENEYSVDENGDLILDDLSFAAFNAGVIEYYEEFDDQGEYPFLEAVLPGTLIEQSGLVTESGDAYELNGGIAWQAAEKIMVGASVNLAFGDYSFDYSFTEIDIANENTPELYSVLLDDDTLLEGLDELSYQQRLSTDMVGVNLRGGISAQLSEAFRVGVSLESPTWTYIEESYGTEFTTRFDIGGELSYGDQSDDIGNGVFEYSMRSPWKIGVGLRYDINRFVLTLEGELIDWTQMRLNSDEGDEIFRDVNATIEEEFVFAVNIALGVEVQLNRFNVRGGVAAKSSPYEEAEFLRAFEDDGSSLAERGAIAIGGGVQITDAIRLDLGFHFEWVRDIWSIYPYDADGPRQDNLFEFKELLSKAITVLQLSVNMD